MFRKSSSHSQEKLFNSISSILEGKSLNQYNDTSGWHNLFCKQIISLIDEFIFSVLFSQKIGAPNSPEVLLVGMMVLKETFGWSDSQLFEQCRFNLLVRCALGLVNLDDEIPVDSTYYLFRKRIHQYMRENNEDLLQKAFVLFSSHDSEAYQLLQRFFDEQYKIEVGTKKVELRPKEEIKPDSVQSPHDPDSAYRHKSDQKVKGYSMNVTETISGGPLDLITNVMVDKANVADTAFVQPAISSTQAVTGTPVEKVYSDGGYQSPCTMSSARILTWFIPGYRGPFRVTTWK